MAAPTLEGFTTHARRFGTECVYETAKSYIGARGLATLADALRKLDRHWRLNQHRSLGIASHWPFEEWGRFLPEHSTAVALLDRLLHHATVVVTAGESFRMKEAKTRGGGRPSAP